MTALPDDLGRIRDAFTDALARSDLVVSTGGLGPTPDDLTREAIAAMLGETPTIDRDLERWLRGLFERRRVPFPDANRKQAWLIPSAEVIPNSNGTAPGWLVRTPEGGIVVALPGPPREMAPMWHDWVVPRLEVGGLGRPSVALTLRLTGIGESAVADRLGALLDPAGRPAVATYARTDAVDVRIWAVDGDAGTGGAADAATLVAETERQIVGLLGDHVWARGRTTWAEAVAGELARRGWQLAVAEVGLRGALAGLLGEGLADRLVAAEVLAPRGRGSRPGVARLAADARASSGAEIGLAAEVRERGGDTAVSVAIDGPDGTRRETRVVFLGGPMGRARAAIAAASILLAYLQGRPPASGLGRAARPGRRASGPATVSRT
jgi:nicotinamide-nucleotide amidase